MTKALPLLAVLSLSSFAAAPPGKYQFVDLQPQANHKLKDPLGSGRDGNDLPLPKGERTCEGVGFKIGERFIQLGSKQLAQEKPNKVEGIKVAKKCEKIHILHATGYGNGSAADGEGQEGDPLWVKDGTKIAEYKINYDDGKSETIPVVYGEDVRDWWGGEGFKGVSRGKMAWKGENELTKSFQRQIRLFLTTWDNPHPGKTIASIDFVKVGDTVTAPFCVAITLETNSQQD
jgi:hypothetical protein